MLLFRFSLSERFLLMDLLLFLNLRRMRRCIRESSLFRTFPGSRRHVLNLNAGMAYLVESVFFATSRIKGIEPNSSTTPHEWSSLNSINYENSCGCLVVVSSHKSFIYYLVNTSRNPVLDRLRHSAQVKGSVRKRAGKL